MKQHSQFNSGATNTLLTLHLAHGYNQSEILHRPRSRKLSHNSRCEPWAKRWPWDNFAPWVNLQPRAARFMFSLMFLHSRTMKDYSVYFNFFIPVLSWYSGDDLINSGLTILRNRQMQHPLDWTWANCFLRADQGWACTVFFLSKHTHTHKKKSSAVDFL